MARLPIGDAPSCFPTTGITIAVSNIALALALIALAAARFAEAPAPPAIAADMFFIAYLISSLVESARLSQSELDKRADVEDEGMPLVFLITLAAIALACVGVFVALNQKSAGETVAVLIALAGAMAGKRASVMEMSCQAARVLSRRQVRAGPLRGGAGRVILGPQA